MSGCRLPSRLRLGPLRDLDEAAHGRSGLPGVALQTSLACAGHGVKRPRPPGICANAPQWTAELPADCVCQLASDARSLKWASVRQGLRHERVPMAIDPSEMTMISVQRD